MLQRYSLFAIFLHWLMALGIVLAFGMGLTMTDIPGITPTKLRLYNWHKWLGVTLLALAAIRLLWRLFHTAPPLPDGMPVWQRRASSAVHFLLYLLLFAVPLSGYFYSLAAGFPVVYLGVVHLPVLIEKNVALSEIVKDVHFVLNWCLATLVFAHLLAVLKHSFIGNDGIIRRMLPVRADISDQA